MRTTSTPRMAIGFAAAGVAAFGAYEILLHTWKRRWRATREEIKRPMPLDEVVRKPQYVTNRAVTIQAAPEAIWPWLSQMGELPRGGFYSYEKVERLLGMRVENADRILPEFQNLRPGEVLDRAGTMVVKAVEPGRFLVLGPQGEPDLEITWALALYPSDETSTRLVSRVRGWMKPSARSLLWRALLGPGQFIMERKMFLEIKRRAEAMPALKVAA
jgi:hypothetical protein